MEVIIELSKTLAKLSGGFSIERLDMHRNELHEMYFGFLVLSDGTFNMEYEIHEDGEIVKVSKTYKD